MRKALLALIVVFFLSISTITSVAEVEAVRDVGDLTGGQTPALTTLSTLRLIKVQLMKGLISTPPYGYLHVIVYFYQIMK